MNPTTRHNPIGAHPTEDIMKAPQAFPRPGRRTRVYEQQAAGMGAATGRERQRDTLVQATGSSYAPTSATSPGASPHKRIAQGRNAGAGQPRAAGPGHPCGACAR